MRSTINKPLLHLVGILFPHITYLKFFYLPTDAQEKCFKKNIKIYIKTAPVYFGAITIVRERIIRVG